MEINVKDYGYDINFVIKNPDGSAVNLTGIGLQVRFLVAEQETYRNLLNGLCVITTGAEGKCKYAVQADDFRKAGIYIGAIRIVYSVTKTVATKIFFVTVNEDLA